MFDRTKRDSKGGSDDFMALAAEEPVTPSPEPRTRTREAAVIGPSIRIKGDLSGEEDLVIQGKVEGTIQLKQKRLTVGAEGKVDANVLAHAVIVEGQVKGDLFGSESVLIRKTGNVHGNIVSPKVGLEEGCRFKGSIDMDDEAVTKAFGKQSSTSPGKPEVAPPKAAASEGPGQSKADRPSTDGTRLPSGTAG